MHAATIELLEELGAADRLKAIARQNGTTTSANLHYCDWIRGWTETCLEVYGEIALRNPRYLRIFEDATMEKVS